MSAITKEFTKEQLQQIIETDHVQCGEASSLARIALASLEAEPRGYIDAGTPDDGISILTENKLLKTDIALYTAPPAPVSVPAAMEMDDDFDSAFEHGKAVGWNAYRAAMLQSFGNSEQLNSPVIQDGWVACVERMPSAGEQVLAYRPDAPESNDPLIKMATYVGGSAHGHGFDCYCKPTHWMPLPAAPQQEVK
ncbi:TPA: DUF551 domain-containing protein [Enterobacter kobei]|nr:DUF551 domain-containing protein [Enterobacter kobei]